MTGVEPRSAGALRRMLLAAASEAGCGMNDMTVLPAQVDPFRIDTPAGHRDGKWLADTAADLGLGDRKIHPRGLHYMISAPANRLKPDGSLYLNNDPDWTWLSERACNAARWLGYIPFNQVVDRRNKEWTVRPLTRTDPFPYLTVGVDVDIPDAEEITPRIEVDGFTGVQPYKLVMFGEKGSLADVLDRISESYKTDIYLPSGEISNVLLYQIARLGAEDGRPMIVLCFSDADPAGWQMPISIGRKLQAFKAKLFPELQFRVQRVALVPDQVRQYDLPSSPLKATEKRGDKWREAMGTEQTEIDALASLRPDLLRQITLDAIAPYFDRTLDERVHQAAGEWMDEAQEIVDDATDSDRLAQLRVIAGERLAAMRQEIDQINDALRVDTGDYELPTPVVPTAVVDADTTGAQGSPLLDSRWSFTEQTRALIDSKAYRRDRWSV